MRSWRRLFQRRSGDAMACQSAVALLEGYLDDSLSPEDRTRLVAHLAGCGHCAEYLAQLRTSIELTGRSDPAPLDAETRTALSDLFRTWQEPS